jgi:catechol 2,3-dioxygenase-like lactoylglutathione lyase family enzyme
MPVGARSLSARASHQQRELSMSVLSVDFVGLRTRRLAETVALFRDVLGLPVEKQSGDLVRFKFADGAVLELYGLGDEFYSFFTTGPVIAFRVANFTRVRQTMLDAGVRFIGELQHAYGHSWQHFHAPDGTVLELSGCTPIAQEGH